MNKRLHSILLVMALPVLLLSCSNAKKVKIESIEVSLPERYSLYSDAPAGLEPWWKDLKEPELDSLVAEAFSGNFTLQTAWARLNQADAAARQARSALFPGLDLTAQASSAEKSGLAVNDYSLGLASSYEIDLWGRIRSADAAAHMTASASREDLNAAAMTLSAQVANSWIAIIAQRREKAILQKQMKTNRTFLELVELRYRNAMASALDVYQQKEALARIEAAIPQVDLQEQLLMHELSLLLGKAPKEPLALTSEELPVIDDLPATGLPADLLAARPDIRAAGFHLYAARWNVETARANRLPALRLSAQGGYGSNSIKTIFDDWFINLAANLTLPLFDANRLRNESVRTGAVEDERLAIYRQTVLTAVKEVEDAIVSEDRQRVQIDAVQRQLAFAQSALDEAHERYMGGLNDYLPVLTELTAVHNLERDLLQKSRDLLLSRIRLYRALGGRWMNDLSARQIGRE